MKVYFVKYFMWSDKELLQFFVWFVKFENKHLLHIYCTSHTVAISCENAAECEIHYIVECEIKYLFIIWHGLTKFFQGLSDKEKTA